MESTKAPALSPETLAAQALGEVDPVSGGLAPVISPATNFEQLPDGSYRQNRVYARADNPTYEHAERLLAALEGAGSACALFASGMAAATAVFQPRRCPATCCACRSASRPPPTWLPILTPRYERTGWPQWRHRPGRDRAGCAVADQVAVVQMVGSPGAVLPDPRGDPLPAEPAGHAEGTRNPWARWTRSQSSLACCAASRFIPAAWALRDPR